MAIQKLQLARSGFGSEQRSSGSGGQRNKPPRRPQPKLRRALARGVQIEYLIDSREHIANCWLAAQEGAFEGLEVRVNLADISKAEFGSALVEALQLVAHDAVLAFVPYEGARRAVALFTWRGMASGEDRHIFPKVIWFPWCSPRNKLEACLAFINEARLGDRQVLWFVQDNKQNERFMRQLCLYGMMKRCCVVEDYYNKGKNALFYTSREKWGL